MNRRKFLKLFGSLLAALPFVNWTIPEQSPELSNRADNADDGYIVFFNMTDGQIAEAKAKWQNSLDNQERGFFYRILTE